jgi:serine/threonine-protein kinase
MRRLHEGFVLGGRYVLGPRIASGGMADVWEATDTTLSRGVAVKVMRPDLGHEQMFALRFRDEAVHSAALLHTNIATVFDYGEDDGLAYLVMERVEGWPLSQEIRERGPLHPDRVVSVIGQAALALGVAHEARVVHRDVKPANILVREDGLVKLTDFGIARALDASGHTRMGEMLGTPHYLSPEQALGEPATGASDLYALGVVAHEMLSGKRPFDGGTPVATALRHVHEPPPPLPAGVPESLAHVIEDLLAKDPADRPPNARAVAVRLGLADHEIIGQALSLARMVYGDDPEVPVDAASVESPESPPTVAVVVVD